MPVDFLTDEQAEAYAHFAGAPSQTELERFFFLDDADRPAVEKRRGGAWPQGPGAATPPPEASPGHAAGHGDLPGG